MISHRAAEALGLDHESRQVAKLCREGILRCRKIANRWLVSRASVEAYQKSYRKPGPRPQATLARARALREQTRDFSITDDEFNQAKSSGCA
jgi:transposase